MVQGMRPRPESPVPHLTLLGCLAPVFCFGQKKKPLMLEMALNSSEGRGSGCRGPHSWQPLVPGEWPAGSAFA